MQRLASFPDERSFLFRLRYSNLRRAIRTTNLVHLVHQRFHFRDGTIQFDEEQAATARIVRVDRGFRSLDREVVHHFDGRGKHACSDDIAHGSARFVCRRESGQQRSNALGLLYDAQNDFGGNAQSAFRSHENSSEVIAGSVECFSAEMNQRSIWQYNFQPQHVRCRKTVFQAMRPAGIFRDVSADAADRLRRRIGRVEIFLRRDASGDVEIDHPGFDDHASIWKINLEDAIHSREADHNPVFNGECAAAQARAGAARNERDSFAVTDSNDPLNFFRGIWQQDRARHDAKIRQSVALVGMQLLG